MRSQKPQIPADESHYKETTKSIIAHEENETKHKEIEQLEDVKEAVGDYQ